MRAEGYYHVFKDFWRVAFCDHNGLWNLSTGDYGDEVWEKINENQITPEVYNTANYFDREAFEKINKT